MRGIRSPTFQDGELSSYIVICYSVRVCLEALLAARLQNFERDVLTGKRDISSDMASLSCRT